MLKFHSLNLFSRMAAASLLVSLFSVPTEGDAADDMQWWLEPQPAGVDEVNEGQLEFLLRPPDDPVHHHQNVLTISQSTLRDGWARLEQCHDHLDPVARAEITFRDGHVRKLSIDQQSGVGKAWVSDHSVQLTNIGRSSRLCLSAETKVMQADGGRNYVLRNGPFMRRFLDGYYPMRVTMRVHYPCSSLKLSNIKPKPQPGFQVTRSDCAVTIDALFEGRLRTEMRFQSHSAPAQPSQVKP